jgi:hypothetical protein
VGPYDARVVNQIVFFEVFGDVIANNGGEQHADKK